jgi:hypothetical protein
MYCIWWPLCSPSSRPPPSANPSSRMSLVASRAFARYPSFEFLFGTLQNHWLACMLFMTATCLIRSYRKRVGPLHKGKQPVSQTSPQHNSSGSFDFLTQLWYRQRPINQTVVPNSPEQVPLPRRTNKRNMRYKKSTRQFKTKKQTVAKESPYVTPKTTQPYDAFLVLDLEGTCELGTDFNYPNEIIVRYIIYKEDTHLRLITP